MKRDQRKIACVVVWDAQMARIVEQAGVDLISVGDSVGFNLWGRSDHLEVSMDEMVLVASAVRRGAPRTLVSCDFPYGPLQESPQAAVTAARMLIEQADVDLVKLDAASEHLAGVEAVADAGFPVFAQFGITPQTAARYGVDQRATTSSGVTLPDELVDDLVGEARSLESAGASLLNLSNAGPAAGAAVVDAVDIPVLGGSGGGPWLDGRIRLLTAAIGYSAQTLATELGASDRYGDVAHMVASAVEELLSDIRSGTQLRGQRADSDTRGKS